MYYYPGFKRLAFLNNFLFSTQVNNQKNSKNLLNILNFRVKMNFEMNFHCKRCSRQVQWKKNQITENCTNLPEQKQDFYDYDYNFTNSWFLYLKLDDSYFFLPRSQVQEAGPATTYLRLYVNFTSTTDSLSMYFHVFSSYLVLWYIAYTFIFSAKLTQS